MFDSPPESEKVGECRIIAEHVDTGEEVVLLKGDVMRMKVEEVSNAMRNATKRNWVGAGGSDPAYTEGYEAIFGKREQPDPELN